MAKIGKVNISTAFEPTSAFPLDIRLHFNDSEKLKEAAMSAVEMGSFDSQYYFGQFLTLSLNNNTRAEAYVVVDDPEHDNLYKIGGGGGGSIHDLEEIERRLDVTQSLTGLTINNADALAVNVGPQSGLELKEETNTLSVKVAATSGLKLSNTGLEINLAKGVEEDEGNVKLTNTEYGLKAEYNWKEYE